MGDPEPEAPLPEALFDGTEPGPRFAKDGKVIERTIVGTAEDFYALYDSGRGSSSRRRSHKASTPQGMVDFHTDLDDELGVEWSRQSRLRARLRSISKASVWLSGTEREILRKERAADRRELHSRLQRANSRHVQQLTGKVPLMDTIVDDALKLKARRDRDAQQTIEEAFGASAWQMKLRNAGEKVLLVGSAINTLYVLSKHKQAPPTSSPPLPPLKAPANTESSPPSEASTSDLERPKLLDTPGATAALPTPAASQDTPVTPQPQVLAENVLWTLSAVRLALDMEVGATAEKSVELGNPGSVVLHFAWERTTPPAPTPLEGARLSREDVYTVYPLPARGTIRPGETLVIRFVCGASTPGRFTATFALRTLPVMVQGTVPKSLSIVACAHAPVPAALATTRNATQRLEKLETDQMVRGILVSHVLNRVPDIVTQQQKRAPPNGSACDASEPWAAQNEGTCFDASTREEAHAVLAKLGLEDLGPCSLQRMLKAAQDIGGVEGRELAGRVDALWERVSDAQVATYNQGLYALFYAGLLGVVDELVGSAGASQIVPAPTAAPASVQDDQAYAPAAEVPPQTAPEDTGASDLTHRITEDIMAEPTDWCALDHALSNIDLFGLDAVDMRAAAMLTARREPVPWAEGNSALMTMAPPAVATPGVAALMAPQSVPREDGTSRPARGTSPFAEGRQLLAAMVESVCAQVIAAWWPWVASHPSRSAIRVRAGACVLLHSEAHFAPAPALVEGGAPCTRAPTDTTCWAEWAPTLPSQRVDFAQTWERAKGVALEHRNRMLVLQRALDLMYALPPQRPPKSSSRSTARP